MLVGDPNQLEAIGKGSPFKYILDDVGFVPMKGVVRQKDISDREQTVNLAEGKVGLAVNHYNAKGNIHIKQDYEVLDSLVSKYSEYIAQDKINDTLVLSYARKDVEKLNSSIRELLVDSKNISLGQSISIDVSNNRDEVDIKNKRFAVGEKIVFLRNGRVEDNQDVKNGLFGNITEINGNIFTVKTSEKENSREINIDITKYNNFDYGYATTVHKAQGTTVENTLMFVNSKGWNRNLAYVGMSRHKDNLDVYVNSNKYKNIDDLKRGLSSKSRKELNVAEFIERKHPANFFDRIKQSLGLSEKYQIKDSESQEKTINTPADKNYQNLGVSKELYNDLVIYSKKILEVSQDRRNFEKIREKNSLAETIYNKHQAEIKSNKDIRVGFVKLPEASKRIIDNNADRNDISRICKGIAEAFKSQELVKSQEREQAISESLGIDI